MTDSASSAVTHDDDKKQLATGPLSLEQVAARINEVAVQTVQRIVADNEVRMAGYAADPKLLNQGCFYGNEYMKALQVLKQAPRLEWFLKKGSFYHGFTSSKCFEMTKDLTKPGGIVASRFVIKQGVLPTEALDSLSDSFTFIGCGEVTQIGYYQALRAVWGDEKFNALLAADSRTPLIIHFDSQDSPLNSLLELSQEPRRFKEGQVVHFANVPLYGYKHINGESVGYNAICINATPEQETFTTLGLSSAGMTRTQIKEVLFKEFAAEPIGMAIVTAAVAKKIGDSCPHPRIAQLGKYAEQIQFSAIEVTSLLDHEFPDTLKAHAKAIAKIACCPLDQAKDLFLGCGNVRQTLQLNPARVHQLADCSIQEARALFDSMYIKEKQRRGF